MNNESMVTQAEIRELVLPVIGACLLMRPDDRNLADERTGAAAEVAKAVVKHLSARTAAQPEREAVLEGALRECADKLWVLRCNSRDDLDRRAAEAAFDMASAALTPNTREGGWYCGHRPQFDPDGLRNFCPPEGCPKGYCARDDGWRDGDASPPRCTGEEFPSNCPDKWHHPEPSDAAIEAWVMDNPKQIPPFISVPSFDDRAEERAVINGRLFLRADFAAFHRQKAEAAAAEKAEIERLRHIVKWAADDFETFSKVYGVLTDSDRSHFSKCSAKFRAALASSEQGEGA